MKVRPILFRLQVEFCSPQKRAYGKVRQQGGGQHERKQQPEGGAGRVLGHKERARDADISYGEDADDQEEDEPKGDAAPDRQVMQPRPVLDCLERGDGVELKLTSFYHKM